MNSHLKKARWIFFLIPTLFAYSETMSNRVETLEKEMKQVRTETDNDTYGAKYATAVPQLKDEGGCFIFANVLYWHAKIGGTEFSYSSIGGSTGGVSDFNLPIQGTMAHNEFDWDWGLKAGVGYNFPENGWDILGRYTWYATGDSETQTVNRANQVFQLKGFSFVNVHLGKAKSKFEIDYQSGDVELGKNSFVSRSLSLRPFFGLKAAWIRLIQNVQYFNSDAGQPDGFLSSRAIDQSRFRGLGPRTGVDTTWFLNNGFHFFADASLALLYGEFKVNHKWKFQDADDPSSEDTNKENIKHEFHRFSPMGRLFIGMGWQDYITRGLFSGEQYLQIRVGYEVEYYWRQNQMLTEEVNQSTNFVGPRYNVLAEDLMFYGLTVQFRLDF